MQEKTQKPTIETVQSKIPAQLRGLFCEPPLLEGEDPNLYWGLVAAVIEERRPEIASDWIAVNDLVTKLWEERLLRNASNALVRAGMLEKLGSFLTLEEEPERGFNSLEEVELSRLKRAAATRRWLENYYKENPKDRKPIGSILAESGLTEPELYARIFAQNSEALQTFERMIAARERGRRKQRKEDRRRLLEERRADVDRAGVKRTRSA
jgi:hypothetical protein